MLTIHAAGPASAFEARSGDDINIGADEVIDGDLYLAGQTIIVNGTVNGDLWAVGRTIDVGGVVTGGVLAGAEMITISGEVGRAVRVGCKTLLITGDVGGDVLTGAQDLNLSGTVLGGLGLGVGNARINGPVAGNISGSAGIATIASRVDGDVRLNVTNLTLDPKAEILGDLAYTSENEASIHAGAQIGGATLYSLPKKEDDAKKCFPSSFFCSVGWMILGFFMALVAGVAMVLLAPTWTASAAGLIRSRPGASIGWGVVGLVVAPILILVACMTIVGIPVALIGLGLYLAALYLCQIPVSLFVGRLLVGRFAIVESKGMMIVALGLGLVIVRLLRIVPYLGFLVGVAVLLFGLGALAVSARKRRPGEAAA
jgi:cytoskeletal protein CcmA (bactofilin family)